MSDVIQVAGLTKTDSAGKTTTIRMLTGLTRLTAGNARILN